MTTRKITTKAVGKSATTYVGRTGEIFYDTATATLKLSDGATAGGVSIGGAASGMAAAGFKPCYYNPTTGEFVYASS
jgi:hypothetical protein